MSHLYGIHDPGGEHLMADKPGWIVFTEAIGCDPHEASGRDYGQWSSAGYGVLVRLNNAHNGEDGTIPHPAQYADFAQRCANYARASRGVAAYIIGNESNHAQERPHGEPITPAMYADCFNRCYSAMKAVMATTGGVRVMLAPVAPWDNSTKYHGNAIGDWVLYWQDVMELVPDCDGLVLHTYTHGAGVHLITSEARMDAPFGHRHYEFRTYRDFMAAVPPSKRGLPVYITETDQVGPWTDANTGWVQAAYAEIDAWNKLDDTQKIMCLCLYRWSHDDKWCFADKQGVHDDFRAAIGRGYQSPQINVQNYSNQSNHLRLPFAPNESPTATLPDVPREIGESFRQRTKNAIEFATPPVGQRYYVLIKAEYVPDGARRFGPDHHILVEVLDANGKRKQGQPVTFTVQGDPPVIKKVDKQGGDYGVDLDLYAPGYSYGVYVGEDRALSDFVGGMGMGTIEQPDWAHHVDFYLVFQERIAEAQIEQPAPPSAEPPRPNSVPMLVHPVADPRYRVVTQVFGVNGDYYKRFRVDGVPLRGHNGIDFGTPEGTPIVAVADGVVVEVADEGAKGYGRYVKIAHPWGESLYAHLAHQDVSVGASVVRGVQIGLSGNTGNSTGPHLHFGLRVSPFDRRDGWGGYTDPGPYLINSAVPVTPEQSPAGRHDIVRAICSAALEFDVDSDLLLSQAWAESSFNPRAMSNAGAQGLFQIMPATWAEWGPKVGASDPFGVTDSARVGTAYMAWLLKQTQGFEWDALVAYGWGIGNLLDAPGGGTDAPAMWTEYANKIIHGRDLLKAVGA